MNDVPATFFVFQKMGPNVVEAYFEACMGDYLSCPLENKQDCGCTTIEVLTEICGRMNAPVEKWRQSNFCREYKIYTSRKSGRTKNENGK